MVIFTVIFAIFFCGIKKTGNSFFPKSTFINLSNDILSLPCFPLKWRAYEFFTGGHRRTPVKVGSNLTILPEVDPGEGLRGLQPPL